MGKQDKIVGMPVGRGYQATRKQKAFPILKLYALGSHGKSFASKVGKSDESVQGFFAGQKGMR